MKPCPQRANELVAARHSASHKTRAQQASPIKSLQRLQAYRGAHIVRQPAGHAGAGALRGWPLGTGTLPGILVLGVFSSLSLLQSTLMPKDESGGKMERSCPCSSLGVGFFQNQLCCGSAQPLLCPQVCPLFFLPREIAHVFLGRHCLLPPLDRV